MPREWESVFKTWTKPSSDSECEKQERAERMIREAIREYIPLNSRKIKVIPQGSYRNNTNVRQESDVDICVCCTEPFYDDYAFADYGRAEAGVLPSGYAYAQFKNDVEHALVKKFGRRGVTRGDKAFDVHENSVRVDADVVAAFGHRRYQAKYYNFLLQRWLTPYTEPEGTQFYADTGEKIVNWPEQHYANGVAKNKTTGNRFKQVVRAIKNLKYDMEASGNAAQKQAAKDAPSYLLECLTYNIADALFIGDSPRAIARNVIATAFHATKTDQTCSEWQEVNGMKYLLRGAQPWTRAQANNFILKAWEFGEFS